MSTLLCISMAFLMMSCDAAISAPPDESVPATQIEGTAQKSSYDFSGRDEALAAYADKDLYVVIDADIDMDGVLDKIVSSAQNAGTELIFFKSLGGEYRKVLVSTNFTEDGGKVLGEIKQTPESAGGKGIVSIGTFFPRGMDVATHYITYSDNEWWLSRTVYEVSDWRIPEDVAYRCEVVQKILMRNLVSDEAISMIRQIPDESIRDEVCARKDLPEP